MPVGKSDISKLDIAQLGSLISSKLREQGIEAILVGGACVTIYSHNQYRSFDLDYVTYDEVTKIEVVLKEMEFQRLGRIFSHKQTPFLIDLVAPPVAIGNEIVTQFETLATPLGNLVLLTPMDCVKGRLAGFYHWEDRQSLEQAILVARDQGIDSDEIRRWSAKEGHEEKCAEFLAQLASALGNQSPSKLRNDRELGVDLGAQDLLDGG